MTKMQLGDIGEDVVRLLATRAGISVNSSSRDRTGWDHLFELELDSDPRTPLDSVVSRLAAFVQVKSTRARESCDVKLSVLERACKDPMPWFFMFVVLDDADEVLDAFLMHVDRQLIETVLRRLRVEHAQGTRLDDLHQKTLSLRWSEVNRISREPAEFRSSLLACLGDPSTYATRKQMDLRSIGYTNGKHEATISFKDGSTEEDFVDAMIGARSEIEVASVEVSDVRFDIPVLVSADFDGVRIKFDKRSIGKSVLIGSSATEEHRVQLETFVPIRGVPERLFRVRCANSVMSIVLKGNKQVLMRFDMDAKASVSLAAMRASGRVLSCFEQPGPHSLSVRLPRIKSGNVDFVNFEDKFDDLLRSNVAIALRSANELCEVIERAGAKKVGAVRVFPAELLGARVAIHDLWRLVVSSGIAKVEVRVDSVPEYDLGTVLFLYTVPLSDAIMSVVIGVTGEIAYQCNSASDGRASIASTPRVVASKMIARSSAKSVNEKHARFLRDVLRRSEEEVRGKQSVFVTWDMANE